MIKVRQLSTCMSLKSNVDIQEMWSNRIVAILTRLGGRGYCVKENSATYKSLETDPDPDPDFNST